MEWLSLLSALIAFLVVFISVLIIYARWNYGSLEKLGIPVVKPHFLFGSTWESRFTPVGDRDVKWMKEYGEVFGIYEGRHPQIFICDPDLLRLIMVKDCSHFDSKGPLDFGDSLLNEMPDYLQGDKWRLVRSFTSPVFTSAKLRLMNYPMKESLIEFVDNLKERVKKNDGTIEKCAFDDLLFDGLTDLTLRCLFSIKDDSGRFPKLLKDFAHPEGLDYPNLKIMALSFPILFNLIPPTLLKARPAHDFLHVMESLIASRQTPNSPPDVVDICIEQMKKLNNPDFKKAKVTKETILFQAFNFFFSGQDETALLISAMIYHILKSPTEMQIMEKLLAEIDSIWEETGKDENGQIEIVQFRERLLAAEFLNACINEALRLYTFYSTERTCTKDWHCEKYNFKIPKGATVILPLWAINRNPEHFENPEEFNPERFLDGNKEKMHAYAWTPFGHGAKICTGKPLALEVLRVACFYLFKSFQFHLRKDSELKFHPDGPWVFILHEPIYFDISLRN